MTSALKMTAFHDRLCGVAGAHHVESVERAGIGDGEGGRMMAKCFANIVGDAERGQAPRVINSCFPISIISISLVRIESEIDHVAGLLGGHPS